LRLVLHFGLHKTASTAFQTLARDNAAALATAGVHWRVIDGYPAHHEVAWSMLRGEAGVIAAYIAEARMAGASCALISSEELDYVLQVPAKARAIEEEARVAGATDIVWIAALRRPSEAFRSHISELTKHGIHLDPLQGYLEIRRTGGLHFSGRIDGGRQFWNWFFTFDYPRYVGRLRKEVSGRVIAYDYHAPDLLPGAPVLRAATPEADRLMTAMRPPGIVNARLGDGDMVANLGAILKDHGHDTAEVAALLALRGAVRHAATQTGADAIIDAALDDRFGDYRAVLGDGG
jgi:hypothetical protein